MPPELTAKQRSFLNFLKQWLDREGSPPSLRQAAGVLGVSHSAVAQQLKALEEKGYLERGGRYSRRIVLTAPGDRSDQDPEAGSAGVAPNGRKVPIIGRIAAGLPMYAQPEWEGGVVVDPSLFKGENLFALRIRGDSMIRAGILDGDLAVCLPRQFARNNEIVVALIDSEEATVKRFYLHSDRVELRPENERYEPKSYGFDRILIQGRVIGIVRGPEQMGGI